MKRLFLSYSIMNNCKAGQHTNVSIFLSNKVHQGVHFFSTHVTHKDVNELRVTLADRTQGDRTVAFSSLGTGTSLDCFFLAQKFGRRNTVMQPYCESGCIKSS